MTADEQGRLGLLADALAEWFAAHKRLLPFRDNPDPYKIWLSEILAQQTRITALLPYYRRFIERFPTLSHLAAAPEDEVLTLWAGLGYYSRARNLLAAARMIADRYNGQIPADPVAIKALPGVGDYTAGAIASIAFGLPVPAVDGNVRRVHARLEAQADGRAAPWVRALMTRKPPALITESLMELGALICIPKTPRCADCPLSALCRAYTQNQVADYPPLKPKPPKRQEHHDICICLDSQNRVLLRRRNERLLRGLWVFPDETALIQDGFAVDKQPPPLSTARHVFTHIIWEMTGWRAHAHIDTLPDNYGYFSRQDMARLAIPSAMRPWMAWPENHDSGA